MACAGPMMAGVADFGEFAGIAARLAADHLNAVADSDRPVYPVLPADRDWLVGQPLPSTGRPLAELLDDVASRVMAYPMGNGHRRFFGWVNSPPSSAGVVMAPLAAALNPSCAGGEHAGALLERTVLRWLAELVGYPGGGLLTSGASMATIVALAAARHRAAAEDGWDIREDGLTGRAPLVLYASSEGHSCLHKAVELLGMGRRGIRTVPVDRKYRMDPGALAEMIERDRAEGLRPFCVAASAGTVNTGAVDPLHDIADVSQAHGLWLHVDGAYGALGVLATDPAPGYAGLTRADSLALDPHKWLGVPVDCGCLLLREPDQARRAFSLVPSYLNDPDADEFGWFAEYGPEQTRPFRALRAWATISHLGRDGIVRLVRNAVGLADGLAGLIGEAEDFELLVQPVTSIVAFRYRPLAVEDIEWLNRDLPSAVNARGRVFFTGTRLADAAALRACILHPDTTRDDLELLLTEIRATAHQLLSTHHART